MVTWDAVLEQWGVRIKHKDRHIPLGHFQKEHFANFVCDSAKYLLNMTWPKDKTDPAENDPYDRPEGDRRPTTPGDRDLRAH